MDDAEIEMVQRHVQSGLKRIESQQRIIRDLEARGADVEQARSLLITFEHLQALHEMHLARLTGE